MCSQGDGITEVMCMWLILCQTRETMFFLQCLLVVKKISNCIHIQIKNLMPHVKAHLWKKSSSISYSPHTQHRNNCYTPRTGFICRINSKMSNRIHHPPIHPITVYIKPGGPHQHIEVWLRLKSDPEHTTSLKLFGHLNITPILVC